MAGATWLLRELATTGDVSAFGSRLLWFQKGNQEGFEEAEMVTEAAVPSAGQKITGFEAALDHAYVHLGEEFGLYNLLGAIGPATAERVAMSTGISVQQLARWLNEQAAAGYLVYDERTSRFSVWCDIQRN
jgi:hypothetical protein